MQPWFRAGMYIGLIYTYICTCGFVPLFCLWVMFVYLLSILLAVVYCQGAGVLPGEGWLCEVIVVCVPVVVKANNVKKRHGVGLFWHITYKTAPTDIFYCRGIWGLCHRFDLVPCLAVFIEFVWFVIHAHIFQLCTYLYIHMHMCCVLIYVDV